jgi:hypothetical protein
MPKGRPSKPLELVRGHRTKAEKEIRGQAEKSLLTGSELHESEEVANNPDAHKEFLRIKKLFGAINKDDDLSGIVLNQHCLLVAECKDLANQRDLFMDNLEKFEDKVVSEDIPFTEEMRIKMGMQKAILDCDKALMNKRKMLLDIAKENIMTIAGALRSIPKKPEEEAAPDPMMAYLK